MWLTIPAGLCCDSRVLAAGIIANGEAIAGHSDFDHDIDHHDIDHHSAFKLHECHHTETARACRGDVGRWWAGIQAGSTAATAGEALVVSAVPSVLQSMGFPASVSS